MGPLDPPPDFLQTHLVLWVAPRPFSLAPVGFIHKNGTDFMSQYLTSLASSQPSTTPGPLVFLGGIPHGQRYISSMGCSLHASSIYGLGDTSCVPEESALRAPVPQDTTSMGPHCPYLEEDISGSHLCHGVQCVTSHPSSSSPGSSSDPSFCHQHGGPSFSSSPSPRHNGWSSTPVGFIHNNSAHFMSQNRCLWCHLNRALCPVPLCIWGVSPMDSGLFHQQGVLCMPLPITVRGVPRVSLWLWPGVPCAPLSLKTLLPWGLVAQIQKRIFLGCTFAMGFDG